MVYHEIWIYDKKKEFRKYTFKNTKIYLNYLMLFFYLYLQSMVYSYIMKFVSMIIKNEKYTFKNIKIYLKIILLLFFFICICSLWYIMKFESMIIFL